MDVVWQLHAEGGYSKVYINAERTRIKKVTPRFSYNAMVDLAVQRSLGGVISGIPVIDKYEIDDEHITIYMPYYGIPINDLLRTVKKLDPTFIATIISRLCEILVALDAHGIQHTDLKPCNVLYDHKTKDITLIDFNIVGHKVCSKNKIVYTPAYGTWSYSAPEVVFYTKPVATTPSWAIGLLLAYLYGHYPWKHIYKMSHKQISSRSHWKLELQKLHDDDSTSGFPISATHVRVMTSDHLRLYKRCVSWNPNDRPSLLEIYKQLRGYDLVRSNIIVATAAQSLHNVSDDTRLIAITKIFNICKITKSFHVFLRAVDLFERSYTYDSPFTLFEHGCAAHCLALLLMGNIVFDSQQFKETVLTYWQLVTDVKVKDAMWYIAEKCDGWRVLGGCMTDVEMLEQNPVVTVDYLDLKKSMIFKDSMRS